MAKSWGWVDRGCIVGNPVLPVHFGDHDWANRELDDDDLRATTSYGHALILLGVARGRAVAKLEDLARMHQNAARPATAVRSKKGARSR